VRRCRARPWRELRTKQHTTIIINAAASQCALYRRRDGRAAMVIRRYTTTTTTTTATATSCQQPTDGGGSFISPLVRADLSDPAVLPFFFLRLPRATSFVATGVRWYNIIRKILQYCLAGAPPTINIGILWVYSCTYTVPNPITPPPTRADGCTCRPCPARLSGDAPSPSVTRNEMKYCSLRVLWTYYWHVRFM